MRYTELIDYMHKYRAGDITRREYTAAHHMMAIAEYPDEVKITKYCCEQSSAPISDPVKDEQMHVCGTCGRVSWKRSET